MGSATFFSAYGWRGRGGWAGRGLLLAAPFGISRKRGRGGSLAMHRSEVYEAGNARLQGVGNSAEHCDARIDSPGRKLPKLALARADHVREALLGMASLDAHRLDSVAQGG